MNDKKLQALYGLKWNPFSPEVPTEALWSPPGLDLFCSRLQHQIRHHGGFALVSGEPGTGKSAAMRLTAHRLAELPDLNVGVIIRPQSRLADFYRELGYVSGVPLAPHNRWAGSRSLREKWMAHIEQTLHRPVLLIDEAQEMHPLVVSELRLLASADFDSRSLLTVVLCGDSRLLQMLKTEDLLPVASRIRARLLLEPRPARDLLDCLQHSLDRAGNPQLLTPEVMNTLCEHALGNPRVLMQMAEDLLLAATSRDLPRIDEKLYLEVFAPPKDPRTRTRTARS
ncbi:MAG: ATP-binding protein [Thermoanaerobaculaceae bacterium]|nr:ATP-binding protein [Thermoanaerobaculaceae bacterium]